MNDFTYRDGKIGILFCSRGRGRGHAMPDIAIYHELLKIRPDIEVSFASYATGFDCFVEQGYKAVDLGLPEANPFVETLLKVSALIRRLQPELMICHEEFAALPAAKIFGVPVVLLSEWLLDGNDLLSESIGCADAVILMEERGIFPEPDSVRGKVRYVGPTVRPMCCTRQDRNELRKELNISGDSTVITVLPGGWTEQRAPIIDLVLSAFEVLDRPKKRLLWVAGKDHASIVAKTKCKHDVEVVPFFYPLEKLMCASDAIITKGNRITNLEAFWLGIPSISISYGLNPIDDILVRRIPSNIALTAQAIDREVLCECMTRCVGATKLDSTFTFERSRIRSPRAVAETLSEFIDVIISCRPSVA